MSHAQEDPELMEIENNSYLDFNTSSGAAMSKADYNQQSASKKQSLTSNNTAGNSSQSQEQLNYQRLSYYNYKGDLELVYSLLIPANHPVAKNDYL